jgi:hypothetical protein
MGALLNMRGLRPMTAPRDAQSQRFSPMSSAFQRVFQTMRVWFWTSMERRFAIQGRRSLDVSTSRYCPAKRN